MAVLSLSNVRISGISACVPKQIVRNMDYNWIGEEERRMLIKTTGVAEKRKAPVEVITSDLCFQAAEKLISELKWRKEEIDALIFVSQSGDYYVPATGIILQDRLGLSKNCMAFDVGLGCSGYVYGLSIVSGLLQGGTIKKALLLAGDISASSASPRDKSTYPLFGDAGTATALEFSSEASTMKYCLQSDGSGYDNLIIYDGYCRNPVNEKSLKYNVIEKGIERRPLDVALNGAAIFDFALREVIPSINHTLNLAGMALDNIDYFVLHQANLLMNETLRKMMKIAPEKVPYSLHRFGNTSSASIPLTIVTQLQKQMQEKSLTLLLCGFGVGLSWGTCILQTNKIVCPDILEYDA